MCLHSFWANLISHIHVSVLRKQRIFKVLECYFSGLLPKENEWIHDKMISFWMGEYTSNISEMNWNIVWVCKKNADTMRYKRYAWPEWPYCSHQHDDQRTINYSSHNYISFTCVCAFQIIIRLRNELRKYAIACMGNGHCAHIHKHLLLFSLHLFTPTLATNINI